MIGKIEGRVLALIKQLSSIGKTPNIGSYFYLFTVWTGYPLLLTLD